MKTLCICAGMMLAIAALAAAPDQAPLAGQAVAPPIGEHQPAVSNAVQKVKRALREMDLPSNNIIVSTHADTVVLTGRVASKADAARALATATQAAGSVRVTSQIEAPEPGNANAAPKTPQ